MSKVNEIKNKVKINKSASELMYQDVKGETNNREVNRSYKKEERKRVSFDLRTDLHKQLKMQALLQEKNIYILIEEALEKHLKNS